MLRIALALAIVSAFTLGALVAPGGGTTAHAQIAEPPTEGFCPEGWVPRPPELNPLLGPCIPGTILANPLVVFFLTVDPAFCPPGWSPVSPPVSPQLRCLPDTVVPFLEPDR